MLFGMSVPIPATTLANILAVQHAKSRNPHYDIRQAVYAAMGDATVEEKMSVAARLIALSNLLLLQPELQSKPTETGSVVHVSVMRAAARAPLLPTERPALLLFELDSFLKVLAEESDPSAEA
jgi:hypothetical protein